MRLEITRKTDLATRAMIALARVGTKTKASLLAEAVGTTTGFLSQVMTPLVAQGWVRSDPGPTGGYTCLIDINNISILEVIEAIVPFEIIPKFLDLFYRFAFIHTSETLLSS